MEGSRVAGNQFIFLALAVSVDIYFVFVIASWANEGDWDAKKQRKADRAERRKAKFDAANEEEPIDAVEEELPEPIISARMD